MTMRLPSVAAAVLAAALLVTACGGSSSPTASKAGDGSTTVAAADGSTTSVAAATAAGKPCVAAKPGVKATGKPDVPVPVGPPPTALATKDLKVGTGAEAKVDGTVTVQYVLVACSTGEEVEASWNGSGAFTGQLSKGSLIDGWVQGIPGMKAGGRRLLVIPPALGYGANGSGGILPGETLIFVVDLVSVP